ncbi:leucine-rich repeat-containing protein 59 isoform 1-T4 [Discoglossus pictus]
MSRGAGKAGNLRDKLDGNELDLSLSDLSEIPVRELAALPKATALDLSCNKLTSLPGEFCSLTHIVRLDLSKNQLLQLPPEFGRLINLQHLDLLQNRLTVLPVTFAQLRNLKWLDLKDNPLNPALAKVAGDCLDEKQCKESALRVLEYMKVIQAEQDKEIQHKLMVEQARKQKRESEQRQKEERDRELRKREKAQQKERKRRDYQALQEAQKQLNKTEREKGDKHKSTPARTQKRRPPERSCMGVFLRLLLLLFIGASGTLAVCRWTELKTQNVCTTLNTLYDDTLSSIRSSHILERILQQPGSQ